MNNTIKPNISVIIPVYNTGAYLEASLESVINQTLKNIEIIVVNDGSTDNSAEIIESYVKFDKRISVINQINAGPSIARNNGLKTALGDYIYFMDSDDLIFPETLETCFNYAKSECLDIVSFDAVSFYDNSYTSNDLFFDYSRKTQIESKVYSGRDFLNELIKNKAYKASVCLYIFNRELCQNLDLLFLEGVFHEDELFTPQLFINASRIGYLPLDLFNRRIRSESTMTKKFSKRNLFDYLKVTDGLSNSSLIKENDRSVIKIIVYEILNVITYRSNSLKISDRIRLLFTLAGNYDITKIKPKNLLVLLFPALIRIKKIFKK